jgi:hypothetical protein
LAEAQRSARFLDWRAYDNTRGDGGLTKRERRFVASIQGNLTQEVVERGELDLDWKTSVCETTWPSIGFMKPGPKKDARVALSYDAMLAHPNVREALKATFAAVGFTEQNAAAALVELAAGKAKTVVTVVRDGENGYTETRTTEHPPSLAALKQYYDLTHEPPTQRHEHLNVNVDVMKDEPLNVTPRAVGDLGPAEHGAINVFADVDEDDDEEEVDGEEDDAG